MTDTNKKSPLSRKLKNSTSRLGLRALEPRILLDAAGFVTGADVAMDAVDTQNVAEDMALLFDGNTTLSPRGEAPEIETLISALNAVDAENETDSGEARLLDDGGKDYGVKSLAAPILDEGSKDYGLIQIANPSESDVITTVENTSNSDSATKESFDIIAASTTMASDDTDSDGVIDDEDIDDDNDGVLDTDEGNGGTYAGQFDYDTDDFDTDGVIGFSSSVAELDGLEITTGQSSEYDDGERSPLLSEGDIVTYSMNGGTMILAISIDTLSDDAEIGIKYRDEGGNPNFELRGVSDTGGLEESAGLSLRFYDATDPAFAAANNLGDIAQLIEAGNGDPIQVTSSIRISDIDLDGRLEGVSASLDSLASYTLEGNNGSFTPVVEDDFVVFRGTVVDPSDNVQLNFLNVDVFEINLLNNESSRAGFSFNFSQFDFDSAITTTTGLDSDGDGIEDHLDIDSDNDGITDNIEAQSTAGYIAPNADDAATLTSNAGLNSAYVPTNGLTAVNTDNDSFADYLETDSDDDGSNDTVEAGLTGTATGASDASTDVDGDGLFDVFDAQNGTAVDDGFDVNESISTGAAALPDTDGDAAGDVPLSEDVDFRDATIPLDSDNDGIADDVDVDDDNDGILDVDEGVQTQQVQGQLQYTHNENGGEGTGATFVEYGGSPAVSDVIASAEEAVVGAGLTVLMTGQGTDNASSYEYDLEGADTSTFADAVIADDYIEMSFTTQDTLSSLSYLFHSFSAEDAGGSNRGDYRVTYLISDDGFATSDVIVDDFQFQSGTTGSFNGQFPSFEEYFLDSETRYSVRVYVYDAQNNPAGQITFNDQTFEFNQVTELDSDNDGIINRLDIDSDNDGITDNIEAQTTAGYIAPSGVGGTSGFTDVNQDGLDDNFDNRNTENGASLDATSTVATSDEALIAPVDTDTDGTADFLDTDSDNEGDNDTIEAGLTGTATGLSDASTDADGDGLFDVFDTQNGTAADDGFDVNESIVEGAAALQDSDNDVSDGVPLISDADFRDAINIAPPLAQDDAFSINEDPEGGEIGVVTNGDLFADNANGADSDSNGDPLSITQINGVDITDGEQITLASGALLTIRTDGTFDYDPNGAFDYLSTDEIGTETFTYTLSDGTEAETDSATVTITVTGDNDAPIVDLNGVAAGTDFLDDFVEDEPGQPLANLVAFDAIIQDDEDNIAEVIIIISLPIANDGADEYLRIDSDGIDLSIGLMTGTITANTPLVYGDTTFEVTYVAGQVSITNADGPTFNSDDLQGFLRLLAYENVNQDNTSGIRGFNFEVIDSEGDVSATSTITVERVNDAPVPTVTDSANGTVVEYGVESPEAYALISPENNITEIPVAELLAQLDIYDVEDSDFGIGIIGADETQGVWQYIRPDIDGHEWTDFQIGDTANTDATPVPDGEALLMDPDAILRFVADPGFSSDAALVFRVWDQTIGTASNPPSTVSDDSGSSAPTNTSSLSTSAFAVSLAADSDGDGIINSVDVDDDNDGILDDVESPPLLANADPTIDNGDGTYTMTGAYENDADVSIDFSVTSDQDINDVSSDSGLQLVWNQGTDTTANIVLTLEQPVGGELESIRVGNAAPGNTFGALNVDKEIVFSWPGGGTAVLVDPLGEIDSHADGAVISSGEQLTVLGDARIFDSEWYLEIDLSTTTSDVDITYDAMAIGTGGIVLEGFAFSPIVLMDSDGDGYFNQVDLDSDDDGIVDNIEGQTTDGYIAPTGTGTGITDVNQDGLDDNYDTRSLANGGVGLTATDSAATVNEALIVPVDTDSLGGDDYLDPDSDNDGVTDAEENGLGVSYTSTDTDGDGLADVYEAAIDGDVNDGFVVNEGISPLDGTLADIDEDAVSGSIVPLTADLDYRDILDTDNDGVTDRDDIDNDNDGILDVVESPPVVANVESITDNGDGTYTMTGAYENDVDVSMDFSVTSDQSILNRTSDSGLQLTWNQGTETSASIVLTLEQPEGAELESIQVGNAAPGNTFGAANIDKDITFTWPGGGTAILVDPLGEIENYESGAVLNSGDLLSVVGGSTVNQSEWYLEIDLSGATGDVDITYDATVIGAGAIQFEGFAFNPIVVTDTDGDGIADHLDIDSDNDGITDNVEAQTTAGYIAPSGLGGTVEFIDVDGDGLDDNYDADTNVATTTSTTSLGLTPVNTDAAATTSDTTPDYLDTDSDNDGLNDTLEAGLGTTPSTEISDATTDADGDGLMNVFEDTNINDGFDVNDTNLDVTDTTFNLPGVETLNADGSNAIPLVTDLDFRDLNDAPVIDTAIPDTAAIDGETISIMPDFSDADGDTLSYSATGLPAGLSIDPVTGEITGEIDNSASQVAGGVYTISVTADDGNGGTTTDTFELTVTNPDPVVNTAIEDQTAVDGEVVSITPDFVDPDGDDLIYTASGLPTGLSIDPITGEITGTLDNSASQDGPNSDGVYTVTITSDDGEGGTVTDTFDLTVTNPAPVAVDDALTASEDAVVIGNVITSSDSDPDGDTLSVSEVDGAASNIGTPVAGSTGGLFTIDANGDVTFDPNGEFESLDVGETATTTLSYEVSDGEGGTDTATVTVTVTGQNDAPVLIDPLDPTATNPSIPDQIGNDSEVLPELDLSDYFVDPDVEQTFFDIEEAPSWLSVNPFTGVLTATTTPADASQGGPNGDGVYPITVVASDPDGVETRVIVNYVISNPAPIAQDDVQTAAEDGPGVSGNVISDDTGNGVDIDPDGDVLSVAEVNGDATLVGQPVEGSTGGEFVVNADGSYSFDPSGDFEYLAVGETIETTLTYLVSDNEGGTDLATVTVTVEGANDAPIAVDPTQPVGPTDPTDPSDPQDPRDPPVDSQNYIPAQTGDDSAVFTPFDLTPYFGDPDGSDDVTLSIDPAELPEGLVFDPVTGILSGTPSADASQGGVDGVYTIPVTATDPSGETFTTYVEVTINNPAPLAFDDVETTDEDTVISDSIMTDNGDGVDYDPDGDVINVSDVNGTPITSGSVITLPSGALLTMNDDGTYDYDPNGQFEGLAVGETSTDSFTYQITDHQGGVSDATVTLTIEGVNDAPIAVDPTQPVGPSDPADPSDPQDPRDPPVDPLNYIPAQSGEDGSSITPLDLTPYFGDPDGSDEVTLSIDPAELPDGLVFDPATGILSGTPSADASQGGVDGVYIIPVTATDPSGETFTTYVTYTVTNPAPEALDDGFTTPEDTPLTVNIIDNNDTDPDGDTLVIDAVALPDGTIIPVGTPTEIPQGTLTVLADGTVTLDPARDLFGPVIFGYTLSDGQGGTDVATVTIDVTPVNDAPIPVDPTQDVADPNNPDFPTDPETPFEMPLDPENYIPVQTGTDGSEVTELDLTPYFGDPDPMETLILSVDPADLPPGLSFDPSTGVISGTPTASASQGGDPTDPGTYVIAVTATDPSGESFTTNVTYMIDNPPPVAADDSFDASEDVTILGDVITGSDVDPDGDVLSVTQVGGDPLNVAQPVAGDQGGLFTIDATGALVFDTNGDFESLDVGETALTAITYEISDGEGGFDTATVTVTVMGTNDAPIATGTLAPQTGTDSAEQIPLDASTIFSDVDDEPLTFSSADLPAWMVIDPVTGVITGTPPADASQGGPNSDGVYVVTVTATDPEGETVSSSVTYTFANLAPVAEDDDLTTDEDTTISGNVIAVNDTDPDGDVLTISAVDGLPANIGQSVEGSLGGEFTLNADGTYDFDPAGDFNTLGAGETVVTAITYEISDGEGGTDTATVMVTVVGTNDAPIPVDPTQPAAIVGEPDMPVDPQDPHVAPLDPNNYIPAQTGSDSSDVTPFDLTPYFGDPDSPDEVTLSIEPTDLPLGLSFDPATGIISGTLDPSASQGTPDGVFEIPVTATDPSGETFTTFVTYVIDNPAPIVDTAIADQAGVDGESVSIPSAFSDPDGDVLTYTAEGLPAGLSIDPATGEISGMVDNSASQGGPNTDGVYTITVTADDGEGGTVTDTFEYSVTNPGPDAADDSFTTSEEAVLLGSVISGSDTDPDLDDLFVTEVAGNAANVGMSVSGSTGGVFTISPDGTLTFDPSGDFEALALGETATSTIAYQISDGEGGTDTAIATVTIEGTNDAPVVTGPLAGQMGTDSNPSVPFDASTAFTDVDGDPLTFTATGLPEGLTIDPVTGLITGTPPADASQGGENSDGVYVVEVTAIDPSGETVSAFVTYTFENPAPVANDDVISTLEDTPVSLNLIDNDSDPDGDTLVIDMAALPDGTILPVGTPIVLPEGELTISADGTVDFTPAPDFYGDLIFGYTVSDGEGGTDVATVTLNVEPVNDAPILVDPNNTTMMPTDPWSYIPIQSGLDNMDVTPFDLTAYFGDPDPADVVTISLNPADLPEGLVFDPATGVITGTPSSDASQGGDPLNPGTYVILVTVTDPSGESVSTNLTYAITNPAPVAQTDGVLPVMEDTPTVLDLLVNDADPDGDVLTITEINGTPVVVGVPATLPSGAIATLNSDGTVNYEPVADYNGPESFTYTISDGEGGTDVATVNLDVIPMNDAPVVTSGLMGSSNGENVGFSLSNSGAVASVDGTELSIPTAAVFSDPDGDALTYEAIGLPDGLSIDPETGVISGTIENSASETGSHEVTLIATDSEGVSVEMTFTFNVTNPAPVIGAVDVPVTDVVAGQAVSIDVGAVTQDPDADVLTYSVEDLPAGLTLDPKTGLITGTPMEPQDEPYVFTVTVTDADGAQDEVTLTLQVNQDSYIAPNETADLGKAIIEANAADPYAFLEGQPIDLQRYFHDRALDARDEFGRMFGDRDFRGGMVVAHVPGIGHECAYMVVEAVAYDHNLTVALGSTVSTVCGVNVASWDVDMANGSALPEWVNWSNGDDFMDVTRPADAETLRLRIKALLDNGRTSSMTVNIDLNTGLVTQEGDAYAQGQTLQQQLALEAHALEEQMAEANIEQDALMRALAG